MRKLVVQKFAETGKMSLDWLDDLAKKAVASMVSQARASYGDPAKLGRLQGYGGEGSLEPSWSDQHPKAVSRPEFDPSKTGAEQDQEFDDWAVDRLMRELEEQGTGSAA
jgi:hypothetical protein